jgi:hypothetical protein
MRSALMGLVLAVTTLGCGSSSSASSCQQYYADNVPGISAADQSFCLNQGGKQAGNCCVSNGQCISPGRSVRSPRTPSAKPWAPGRAHWPCSCTSSPRSSFWPSWRSPGARERLGGILFLLAGALYIAWAWNEPFARWEVFVMMAGPPTLIGALFLGQGA